MHGVGRKETAIAGPQLLRLPVDLGARAPFQHIADLFDAGMRMRQRALAALDGAVDDFELGRANVFAADDAAVR